MLPASAAHELRAAFEFPAKGIERLFIFTTGRMPAGQAPILGWVVRGSPLTGLGQGVDDAAPCAIGLGVRFEKRCTAHPGTRWIDGSST